MEREGDKGKLLGCAAQNEADTLFERVSQIKKLIMFTRYPCILKIDNGLTGN